jgi:hypothetical protein
MSDMHRHLPGHSTWGGGADWRDEAACLGIDPELFIPVGNTRLVARDHVVEVTTNPTIFAKAITGSDAYGSDS